MSTATQAAVFGREALESCFEEALPLLHKHWQEIAYYLDIPLKPNLPKYLLLEQVGALRIYTARSADNGKLIGYAVFIVGPNLHYSDSIQALQDILYLDPDYRRGRLGIQLIRFSEVELRNEGVQVIAQHAKEAHPALIRILERTGYDRQDVVLTKRLDR